MLSISKLYRRELLVFIIAAAFLLFLIEKAEAEPDVQFPVNELGGCGSKEECHAYCEISENIEPCLNFAEKNGLMSASEISEAKKFVAMGGKGPGGCTTKNSCESFCNNTANIKECLLFAEKSGMMSDKELEEAKKVAKFLESGGSLPGGCRNKTECDSYCKSSNANNMKECVTFAKEAGFLSEEELEQVDMLLVALEKGVPPPNCRGDKECAVYCAEPENLEECAAFSLASGRMTEKEVELMRKYGGKGPGGCIGNECDTFCDDPENSEACFNFAKDRGDIPADHDYQKMKEGRDRFRSDFESMPVATQDCLRDSIGDELDNMLKGNPPPEDTRAKMEECWKKMEVPHSGPEDFPPKTERGENGEFNRQQRGDENFQRPGEPMPPPEFQEYQLEFNGMETPPPPPSPSEESGQPLDSENTPNPSQSKGKISHLLGFVLSSLEELFNQ